MAEFILNWKPKGVLDATDDAVIDGFNSTGRACGKTALDIAITQENEGVASLLRERGGVRARPSD